MKQGNRGLLAILVILIAIVIALAAGNTYVYLSRVKQIQNSIIALQEAKSQGGPQGQQGPSGIVGQQGIQGPIGLQGIQGTAGVQGVQGVQGEKGDTGDIGPVGPQGPQGDLGPQGTPGQDGADGKTPQIRCDTERNEWEIRYSDNDNWQVMNDENGNPTPCEGNPV